MCGVDRPDHQPAASGGAARPGDGDRAGAPLRARPDGLLAGRDGPGALPGRARRWPPHRRPRPPFDGAVVRRGARADGRDRVARHRAGMARARRGLRAAARHAAGAARGGRAARRALSLHPAGLSQGRVRVRGQHLHLRTDPGGPRPARPAGAPARRYRRAGDARPDPRRDHPPAAGGARSPPLPLAQDHRPLRPGDLRLPDRARRQPGGVPDLHPGRPQSAAPGARLVRAQPRGRADPARLPGRRPGDDRHGHPARRARRSPAPPAAREGGHDPPRAALVAADRRCGGGPGRARLPPRPDRGAAPRGAG